MSKRAFLGAAVMSLAACGRSEEVDLGGLTPEPTSAAPDNTASARPSVATASLQAPAPVRSSAPPVGSVPFGRDVAWTDGTQLRVDKPSEYNPPQEPVGVAPSPHYIMVPVMVLNKLGRSWSPRELRIEATSVGKPATAITNMPGVQGATPPIENGEATQIMAFFGVDDVDVVTVTVQLDPRHGMVEFVPGGGA